MLVKRVQGIKTHLETVTMQTLKLHPALGMAALLEPLEEFAK